MHLTRQSFLRGAAATALGACLGRGASAAAERPPIPLGFSLYGMPKLSTVEGLRAVAAIGYDSAELCLLEGFDADPAELTDAGRRKIAATLAATGLGVCGLMENLPLAGSNAPGVEATLERLRQAAELAHQLQPDQPPVIETILGGKQWEEDRHQLADGVAAWARVAQAEQITVAVKPHRMNAMNRPEHALWLLDQVASPRIRIAYDYSHFALRDMPMRETLDALLPHTAFVHVKDVTKENDRIGFALPGAAGTIDYAALLAALREAKYPGDVCVEVSSMLWKAKDYDPIEAAQFSHARLREAGA